MLIVLGWLERNGGGRCPHCRQDVQFSFLAFIWSQLKREREGACVRSCCFVSVTPVDRFPLTSHLTTSRLMTSGCFVQSGLGLLATGLGMMMSEPRTRRVSQASLGCIKLTARMPQAQGLPWKVDSTRFPSSLFILRCWLKPADNNPYLPADQRCSTVGYILPMERE